MNSQASEVGAVVISLCLTLRCFAVEVLYDPEDTTVFLDRFGVFKCETKDGITSWYINGTLLELFQPVIQRDLRDRGINTPNGTRLENLTIPARAEYNGTLVQCVVITEDGLSSVLSENATFYIQGLVSAVDYLRAKGNAGSVTISWSAPFSLDVTGVDPDIWYSVLIYNVTDENNPTAILCTDCINITETHYTFTPDYLSPCHVFNFSVIPSNGAGQGESSDNVTGYIYKAPPDFIVFEASITVSRKIPKNMFLVVIDSDFIGKVFCHGELPETFVVHYSSTQTHCPPVVSVEASELTPDKEALLIKSEVALGRDCDYTVHLTSRNGAGDTNSTGTLSISTRVLIVEVVELEGEVVVRCVFRDTLSQRCYVQLVSSEVEGGFQEGGCVEGAGEGVHRFPGLLPATYTVLVYGLVAGGLEDSCSPAPGDPDYITVATVHDPHPSSVNNQPSPTNKMTRPLVIPNPWCAEGIGVGVCMGAIATCILFVMGIIVVKVLKKHRQRRNVAKSSAASSQHVAMEKNMAYELHKPQHRRKDHTAPQQALNPIYEDLK